jgi:hypothetical protein
VPAVEPEIDDLGQTTGGVAWLGSVRGKEVVEEEEDSEAHRAAGD